jgi:hypothetical protein
MKPMLANLSPTLPAGFATAVAISLSVLLLAGSGVQGEPTPLLPAIGGAAGQVIAELPAAARPRASEPVRRAPSPAGLVTTPTRQFVPQRRAAARNAQLGHRSTRTGVVRRAAPAPVQVPAPAPLTTAPTRRSLAAKGKARGHGHGYGHATQPGAGVGARGHGNGKALRRHRVGRPPGQAKKAPTASPAVAAPPKTHGGGAPADQGGGNGHNGGKK